MKLLLDTYYFKKKPVGNEIGSLSNRISKYPVDITPEELAQEIIKGKTFAPVSLKEVGEKKRNQINWLSQEIICLDFDNEISIPDPNNSNKKIKVKDVKMTLEAALEEFKDTAMFIYTSFRHKPDHPKFRVVLALDKVCFSSNDIISTYKYFESKYPYIDTSCSDIVRMFYGGKELYEINYSNRIPIISDSSSLHSKNNVNEEVCDYNTLVSYKESNCMPKPPTLHNHIELIKTQSKLFSKLSQIELPPITFNNRQEVYHYLKQISLHDYLNIHNKSCYDIFHNEVSPSGSIYIDPETNYWWYKCWSNSHPFKGTIIDVTERLTGLTKPKSLKWLMDTFNITLTKTEWQREQEDLWNMNMDFLNDEELIAESYPYFNSLMRSSMYYALIRELHLIAMENVSAINKHGDKENAIFYAALDHIMKRIDRYYDMGNYKSSKKKRVGIVISLFVFLKMIERLDLEDIPEIFADRAKKEAIKKKFSNTVSFFSIPSYDATHMIEIENYAKLFKDKHMIIGQFDLQMLKMTLGDDEAERVFPMRKKEKVSNFNLATCELLEKTMMKYIEEFGWVTEKRIIQNTYLDIDIEQTMRTRDVRYKKKLKDHIITEEEMLKWEYEYKRGQLKKAIGGWLTKYDLSKSYCNSALMTERGIPQHYSEDGNPSYPVVIYKK